MSAPGSPGIEPPPQMFELITIDDVAAEGTPDHDRRLVAGDGAMRDPADAAYPSDEANPRGPDGR